MPHRLKTASKLVGCWGFYWNEQQRECTMLVSCTWVANVSAGSRQLLHPAFTNLPPKRLPSKPHENGLIWPGNERGTGWSCSGRQWLAQPPSQDILSSEHHNLINHEKAVTSASENCRVTSVRRETGKPKTRGRLQRLCVRRGIVLCAHTIVRACVR